MGEGGGWGVGGGVKRKGSPEFILDMLSLR